MCREAGIFHVVCQIPKVRLYLGHYTITVHFSEHADGEKFQTIENICPFEIVMYGRHREFEWQPGTCAYLEESEWRVEQLEASKI
jgi:lipopolysaccharide transport system ATP-binding protein